MKVIDLGKASPSWSRQAGLTSNFAEIAAFLRKNHGIRYPQAHRILPYGGIARLLVSLRQVALVDQKLWVVRDVPDFSQILYSTEAMKHLGFKIPELRLFKDKRGCYAFQELLLRVFPCFLGAELSDLAPRILPAVLAAHGTELSYLNLTLEKFLTLGHDKFYIGLRPRGIPSDMRFIVWNLMRAGLIDPKKGVEQFEGGIQAAAALDTQQYEVRLSAKMERAGMARDEIQTFIQKQKRHRRDNLIPFLEFLIRKAEQFEPEFREALQVRQKFMIQKSMLQSSKIRPHLEEPKGNIVGEMEGKIEAAISKSQKIDFSDLVNKIINESIRVIRIEGGTARGKSTFMPKLVEALKQRGVISIGLDDVGLRPHEERAPIKENIAEAIGFGYISFSDGKLCFDWERMESFFAQLVRVLNSDQPEEFKLVTFPRTWVEEGGAVVRRYGEREIRVDLQPATVVVLEGKFQCYPRLWKGLSVPQMTILVYAPLAVAIKRNYVRADQALAREQLSLFRYWLEPSYFQYVKEVDLLSQTDVIIDTSHEELMLYQL